MKVIVYGTMNCPDTVDALREYKARGVDFEFRDIDADIKTLKEFLKLRDTEDVFAEARQEHFVGVPCVVRDDGSLTLDWESLL